METKSLIRHILTGLGSVLTMLGVTKYAGLLDYISSSLDGLWIAGSVIVGAGIAIYGFFRGKAKTP